MGQKVNASAFRRLKTKSWNSSSHFLLFNYNVNVNTDLQIVKYLKGFLFYWGISSNFIKVYRFNNKIYITILFYNNIYSDKLKNVVYTIKGFKGYKFFKSFQLLDKKKRLRSKQKGWFTHSFKHLNIYSSYRWDRFNENLSTKKIESNFAQKQKKSDALIRTSFVKNFLSKKSSVLSSFYKYSVISPKLLVFVKFIFSHFITNFFSFRVGKEFPKVFFLYFSKFFSNYSLVSSFKVKLFYLYIKMLFRSFTKKLFLYNVYSWFILLLNSFSKNFITFLKSRNKKYKSLIKSGISKKFGRRSFVNKQGEFFYKFEGLSFKRLVLLYVYRLTKIKNISINLLNFNNPKKLYHFFNVLKKNVKIRGPLQKKIFSLYLILYQSLLLKNPELFSTYLSFLIKKYIKKTGQIFIILKSSLPGFCKFFGCRGIRIQLKGRINGARRSRIWKMQYGRIPLQTVSSNVYYSFNNVMTVHGLYGLKIWYYI